MFLGNARTRDGLFDDDNESAGSDQAQSMRLVIATNLISVLVRGGSMVPRFIAAHSLPHEILCIFVKSICISPSVNFLASIIPNFRAANKGVREKNVA